MVRTYYLSIPLSFVLRYNLRLPEKAEFSPQLSYWMPISWLPISAFNLPKTTTSNQDIPEALYTGLKLCPPLADFVSLLNTSNGG